MTGKGRNPFECRPLLVEVGSAADKITPVGQASPPWYPDGGPPFECTVDQGGMERAHPRVGPGGEAGLLGSVVPVSSIASARCHLGTTPFCGRVQGGATGSLSVSWMIAMAS